MMILACSRILLTPVDSEEILGKEVPQADLSVRPGCVAAQKRPLVSKKDD